MLCVSPRSMNVAFTIIGLAIQKSLAVQLVTCLPYIYM